MLPSDEESRSCSPSRSRWADSRSPADIDAYWEQVLDPTDEQAANPVNAAVAQIMAMGLWYLTSTF